MIYTLMEVINPQPTGPNFFQVIGLIGGLLGIVALLSLPWTIRKLSAETKSIEVSTDGTASEIALKHLQAALEEADKTIKRLREDTQNLKEKVELLSQALEEERRKSERERELYERRVVQLLYDLHSKDLEIANLRGRPNQSIEPPQNG